jgi:uridine kinase
VKILQPLKRFDFGTSLSDIANLMNVQLKYPILGALVDNEARELSYRICKPCLINFIDITHNDGMRMYFRSLYYVLMKAVKDIMPDSDLFIEHSVSNGYFCEIKGLNLKGNNDLVAEIKLQMQKIIGDDIPFERVDILNTEAIEIFENQNFPEKANLFKQSPSLYTSVYKFENMVDYFYGCLVPSSSYLFNFDLEQIYDGMLLKVPKTNKPKN